MVMVKLSSESDCIVQSQSTKRDALFRLVNLYAATASALKLYPLTLAVLLPICEGYFSFPFQRVICTPSGEMFKIRFRV